MALRLLSKTTKAKFDEQIIKGKKCLRVETKCLYKVKIFIVQSL